MQRRALLFSGFGWLVSSALEQALGASRELAADVAILGGGTGGVAAALAALRDGMRVVMTEECEWIGGQLTSQAVPPDEHPWIEGAGGTALYRRYRSLVRQYYRDHYPLTAEARANEQLNPGGGTVSRLTHEPRVSLAVLEGLLSPYLACGKLVLLTRHQLVKAEAERDRIRSVTVKSALTGTERVIRAPYFLDATEQGDLLPLAQVEFVTGFESQKETAEPSAPAQAQPNNIQSFTVCFPMDYLEGEDHTIEEPTEYKFWRDYVPQLKPAWPGKLLSWTYSQPITLEPRTVTFDPIEDSPRPGGTVNFWHYRRIARRKHMVDGAWRSDVTLVNWPQNDYWLGNLHNVSDAEAAKHLARAKQLSLSLFHWMQTEAPRPDGGTGWRGLRLRGDLCGTEDGLAMYPYIRESRRIRAEFTVVEQHVATARRPDRKAESYADSVGVGSYRIDLHPSSGGDNYIDVSSLPFQIPMGALIPRRVENLLAAAKNLGVTHITNGCYRLHPVEWNIGESAGALAAECVKKGLRPRQIRNDEKLRAAFQQRITGQGIEIRWPEFTAR